MADLSFNVAPRRVAPKSLTFTLGNSAAEMKAAEAANLDEQGNPLPTAPGVTPSVVLPDPHVFTFTPPKEVTAMLDLVDPNYQGDDSVAMMAGTFDWLAAGLNKEDQNILLSRLRDPEDALDMDDLLKIVEGLNAKIAERPTS